MKKIVISQTNHPPCMLTDGTNQLLIKLLGKSWRTTLSSAIAAIALFVHLNSDAVKHDWLKRASAFAVGGGLISFGINCKDKQNSGQE